MRSKWDELTIFDHNPTEVFRYQVAIPKLVTRMRRKMLCDPAKVTFLLRGKRSTLFVCQRVSMLISPKREDRFNPGTLETSDNQSVIWISYLPIEMDESRIEELYLLVIV